MADLTASSTAVADLLRAYQQTLVVSLGPGAWRPVSQWCRLRGQGAQVLTAWNPGFSRPSPKVNAAANIALRERLADLIAPASAHGAPPQIWAADGRAVRAPGESSGVAFHEPGFCVWGATLQDVVTVAEEFGQFAIFDFDATGGRSLVPCRDLLALLAGSARDLHGGELDVEPDVKPLYLIAVIKPRASQRERAAQALADLQAATRGEPGCELYDLVTDTQQADDATWLMIEKWSSREHWNAHMATPHVAAMGQLEADLMREPTELRFYDGLS
ncbi:MAG: DUF3293 domain-containing protein [Actinomycetales bacterium]